MFFPVMSRDHVETSERTRIDLAIVDGLVCSEAADLVLIACPNEGRHMRAERLHDLNGGGADAATGAADKDALAPADADMVAQHAQRRTAGAHQGNRCDGIGAAGKRRNGIDRREEVFGRGAGLDGFDAIIDEAPDGVADLVIRDVRPDFDNITGEVVTGPAREFLSAKEFQLSGPDQHVGGVDAGGEAPRPIAYRLYRLHDHNRAPGR
jgi:hypothetical protein